MSTATRSRFVDSAALAMTEKGVPESAGRILATLLICDPPHRTLDQLCEGLDMERNEAEAAIESLVELGHIERMGLPWEATYVFRLTNDFPGAAAPQWLAKVEQRHRLVSSRADLPDDLSESAAERLATVRSYTDYMINGIRDLAEAWPSVRAAELAPRTRRSKKDPSKR